MAPPLFCDGDEIDLGNIELRENCYGGVKVALAPIDEKEVG